MASVPNRVGASSVPPVSPGRYQTSGSNVASANSTPLEAVDPSAALTRDNDTLQYEKFESGDDGIGGGDARRQQSRRLISGLLLETSKGFADAFAAPETGGTPAKRAAAGVVSAGIGTYTSSSDTLENETPHRGRTLSLRS